MKNIYLIALVFAASGAAYSAEEKDPKTQLQISAIVCKQDQQAAVSAVHMRDKGKTKEEMMQHLPERGPNNNRLAKIMYETLDDVYGYPEIKEFPYYVYRSEVCFAEVERQPISVGFEDVATEILQCQSKHGVRPSNEVIDCIRAVLKNESK